MGKGSKGIEVSESGRGGATLHASQPGLPAFKKGGTVIDSRTRKAGEFESDRPDWADTLKGSWGQNLRIMRDEKAKQEARRAELEAQIIRAREEDEMRERSLNRLVVIGLVATVVLALVLALVIPF